jgi:hypothetical protein
MSTAAGKGRQKTHLEVWSVLDVVRVEESDLAVYYHRLLVEGTEERTVEVDNLKGEMGDFVGMRETERRPGFGSNVDVVAAGRELVWEKRREEKKRTYCHNC